MLRSERIAKKINDQLSEWSKSRAKLVVAIDGYAGSGKTTVAEYISNLNADVISLHLDEFIHHWKKRKAMIEAASDKSEVFEYHWYRYADVEKLIAAFKGGRKFIRLRTYDFEKNDFGPNKRIDLSKKILILDGVFLFHKAHQISRHWDKTIYLDADFKRADRKRVAREKKWRGKAYLPEDHPSNWTRHYKVAYRRYVNAAKPEQNASLVFRV